MRREHGFLVSDSRGYIQAKHMSSLDIVLKDRITSVMWAVVMMMMMASTIGPIRWVQAEFSASPHLSSWGSKRASWGKRPPFLHHVTEAQLQRAIQMAQQLHQEAVERARLHYPTHQVDTLPCTGDDPSEPEHTSQIRKHMLQYHIQSPAALPDYGDLLPCTLHVTSPDHPLLTREECATVIRQAHEHFARTSNDGSWTVLPSGPYPVAGFWIKDVPEVYKWFVPMVRRRLFPLLAQLYPEFCVSDGSDAEAAAAMLCVDNAYMFQYTPATGRRTAIHTDSGCLSFTLALNDREEYTGGGTWFEGLHRQQDADHAADEDAGESSATLSYTRGSTLDMTTGQATLRVGGVKHCGQAVTSGTRYIIGGFCLHQRRPELVRMLLAGRHPENEGHSTTSASSSTGSPDLSRQEVLEAAVVLNPSFDVSYNLLGGHYESQGNLSAAQQVWEYCLDHVHPNATEVAYSLGSLYQRQGQYEKAKQCMNVCLSVDPGDMQARMMLAQVCSSLGDVMGEKAAYEQVLATPGAPSSILASAYCNLGVLHQGKDLELHCYRQALKHAPENYQIRYSLASALAEHENYDDAISAFQGAVDAASSPDEERSALENLYKATALKIRQDALHEATSNDRPSIQQQQLGIEAKFREIMGAEYFQRLRGMLSKGTGSSSS